MFTQNTIPGSDISVIPLSDSNNSAYCASCPQCSLNCCNVACPNNSQNTTCQENVYANQQVVLAFQYNFPSFPTTATTFVSYWQDSSNAVSWSPNRLYNKSTNTFFYTLENCYLKSNETPSYTSVLQFYKNNDCSSPISSTEPMNVCSGNSLDYIVLTTVGTGPNQIKNSIFQMSKGGSVGQVPSYPYGTGQTGSHITYPQVSLSWCGYSGDSIYSQCPAFSSDCLTTSLKCASLFTCNPESSLFIANKQALFIPLMFYTKNVSTIKDVRIYRWITPSNYTNIGLQCYGGNNNGIPNSQIYYSEVLSDGRYFCILNIQNGPQTFTTGDIFSIYGTFTGSTGFSTGITINFVVGETSDDTVFSWISSNPIDGMPNPNGINMSLNN